MTPAALQRAYLDACRLDVVALKPGNVSQAAPGHAMAADDFLRSARVSAPAITDPALSLGERIHAAVAATRAAVGCNTNLGIVLLCAPLAQAMLRPVAPGAELQAAVAATIAACTPPDTEAVFAAIRLAAPGGLGRSDRHDVAGPACAPLREVMAHAAARDLIARQYATGYADLFATALPWLEAARRHHGDEALATTDLYLALLGREPDSHVVRRHDRATAEQVRVAARAARATFLATGDAGAARDGLLEFDARLKEAGINPGTTADLVVATLFIARLRMQPGRSAGATRNPARTARPGEVALPHQSTY